MIFLAPDGVLCEDWGRLGTQLDDKAFTERVLGQEYNGQHHQEGTRTGWRVELVLQEKSKLCAAAPGICILIPPWGLCGKVVRAGLRG